MNKGSAVAEMVAQCCTRQIFPLECGYLYMVVSENITINHILSIKRYFRLYFSCRQYEDILDHSDVNSPESY